jgi:T-complex protein 1 subunit gamma
VSALLVPALPREPSSKNSLPTSLTNDGNAILREIDVAHPAAKNMIELSRTQDEECGDGTTSVIVLGTLAFNPHLTPQGKRLTTSPLLRRTHNTAGEILAQSLSQLERDIHPVVIISAYNKALQTALETVSRVSVPIDTSDDAQMLALIKTSIGTKFVIRWADLMCRLALEAVRTVSQGDDAVGNSSNGGGGVHTVDIKRYARVEKVPGGEIEDSRVLSGVMLNKDIVHPQMRRRIHKPRIVLLDCPLEYKKGESQTNIEISKEADFARINQIEEEQVKAMVDRILEFKPDLVITEKGISGPSSCSLSPSAGTFWKAYVCAEYLARRNRLCAIFLRKGERLCAPTRTQVG